MQVFDCKTKIVSGEDALSWLDKHHCRCLLVVTDPYFRQNGWADRIAGRVQAEKREFFDKVKPDPTVELAAEGTALMRQLQPDMLIALGGGSAMDTAKAMVYFAGENVKFIAIPTTSGSGSEVTNFAILTHGAVKHPLIDKRILPDVAILAEELVEKLPPSLVADGGFDVLSHALEAFVATNATTMTRALAAGAFRQTLKHLPASFRGEISVRKQIHQASNMAGIAFAQSGLGMCHALSHSLGGIFHIPHGRLNGILLPEVVARNSVAAGREYGEIARMAGIEGSADRICARNLRNTLTGLRKELRLPATLKEAGVQRGELYRHMDEIVTAALADPCMQTNPVKADREMLLSVLQAVSGFA